MKYSSHGQIVRILAKHFPTGEDLHHPQRMVQSAAEPFHKPFHMATHDRASPMYEE